MGTLQQDSTSARERGQARSLDVRFTKFLESLPGAESLDRLELPVDLEHRRKADFLLAHRKVIVEIKTLTEDTSHKIETLADQHRDRHDWPLYYGKANVRKVLTNLPDGDVIYGKMVNAIGRSVEAAVRSAEEQITHTKRILDLPNAVSVLVILNESVDILDPNVVAHRMVQRMRRPRSNDDSAEKLDFAMLLFESHTMGDVEGRPAVPCILINGNDKDKDKFPFFSAFYRDLVRLWAVTNGGVAVDATTLAPGNMQFASMTSLTAPVSALVPRHEIWRHQYNAHPYLRTLNDDEVLARGADLMRKTAPHFHKQGLRYIPEIVNPLMEEIAHFLAEVNFRGLDMRRMPRL